MDISVFFHDLEEYFSGRSVKVELEPSNGFVYLSCNKLFDNDLSFVKQYGLRFLNACSSCKDGFLLDVCFVPDV